ncbi:pyruvate formate lyase family protein, partial [Peptococcaceae bacterium 1198_IL3148]
LYKISDILTNVPANPPRTFHEALQSIWTLESLFVVEENQTGISLGRLDQYIYPMFKADMEAGRLNKLEAFELMSCFIIKCSEVM